ncbi:unnamed protein product [Absidia cylindrospora]
MESHTTDNYPEIGQVYIDFIVLGRHFTAGNQWTTGYRTLITKFSLFNFRSYNHQGALASMINPGNFWSFMYAGQDPSKTIHDALAWR